MDQNIDFNILDQITTYNYLEIQNNIQKYNKILNNQYHLNRALNEKKSDEIKEDLEEFLINKACSFITFSEENECYWEQECISGSELNPYAGVISC